ncbi:MULTISPECIES: HlyD family efflux transporter periplasmic adaptor subunit [Brucella/Ochrobactrum group]|uniref:Secretion protein HlyD family protein n=1 Tax=Brucella anthropi (strain ATCC 49188 / DSM 6882 / CCUG 24695 / JCM 21032 / LMG 3331 / NBRC 15819 / NCTC 12168 / Alc 37) TaxID=439375 RepID=A6X0X8_BRUA4|nr:MULTISPECIES: HlyD family efflux transporter periplasmic adaptor subunit [Brucella/Ochrobactrum group]ABS14882.1 secretion protein HlyD family protein [Brucella anthropi ATCC 49188]AIK44830.1 hlyD secretion family protein [Brucella anthropi]KAB2749702.1 HlyD family efflux transporter periplasmic adaptor subunit [Brucella anthropi]KAB2762444.1 HlyD family efflux transporter periplasmic adaptor subunit [Brucella anthropi]KAB2778460.1 HlyD family efflux transporter periplasmic adaptor subunit 
MNQTAIPLFRKQAVVAQRDAWLGNPRLIQPISVQLATVIGLTIISLIVAVLVLGEYTRRVRVHGAVVPSAGVLHVFAPQAGRLLQAQATDAATVEAGDPLFLLGTDTTTNLGETESVVKDQLQSRIDEIAEAIRQRVRLDEIEKRALAERRGAVKLEIERVDAQIKQTEEYIAVLQPRADKYRRLVDSGITLERSFESAEQNYMQNRQELEALRRQRVQLEGTAVDLGSRLEGYDASAAIALGEMRQRIATLREQLAQAEARRAIVIAAPANGTIAAVLVHSGQLVAAGLPLVSILPTGEAMEVHLLADSKAIGFIREGARVLLRYTAFPYQKFGQYGGSITKVSRVTLQPTETNADALAAQPQPTQAQYRITVQPDQPNVMAYGKAEPLRAGMGVEADLLLDTRPLYQWLLEPLYSLRGRAIDQAVKNPK